MSCSVECKTQKCHDCGNVPGGLEFVIGNSRSGPFHLIPDSAGHEWKNEGKRVGGKGSESAQSKKLRCWYSYDFGTPLMSFQQIPVLKSIMQGNSASCHVETPRLEGFGVRKQTPRKVMGVNLPAGPFQNHSTKSF